MGRYWKSKIMIKNVGKIDKTLRFLLCLILVWLGLFVLNGKEGSVVGILVAIISLMPFYMALTGSCFVFRWFKIHSLSKKEYQIHGNPYRDGKEWNKLKNTNNKTLAVLKAKSFLLIIYQASIIRLGLFTFVPWNLLLHFHGTKLFPFPNFMPDSWYVYIKLIPTH